MITFHKKVNNKFVKTYIQVDGEYMQIDRPKYMKISLTDCLPNGKINTLFTNKLEKTRKQKEEQAELAAQKRGSKGDYKIEVSPPDNNKNTKL